MKTYYKVTTTFDDRGRVGVFTESVSASEKPGSTFHSGKRFDIYEDYFATEEDAKAFAEESRNA